MPKAYNGSPSATDFWLNSINMYLLINQDIYNTGNKRVGYTLSFMTEGTAKSWAAVHTKQALNNGTFGLFSTFITDFISVFQNANSEAEASTRLTNTCVCTEEYLPKYMTELKLKVIEAQLNETIHAVPLSISFVQESQSGFPTESLASTLSPLLHNSGMKRLTNS